MSGTITKSAAESLLWAIAQVEDRGRSLRTLIQMSETGRVHRASNVMVVWARENHNGLRALCRGRDDYLVTITIDRDKVRRHSCSCLDHGRVGACKHVLSVANRWIEQKGRPAWLALKDAEKVLKGGSLGGVTA